MRTLILISMIGILFTSCEKDDMTEILPKSTTETYTVTFSFNWNKTDFPTDYPSGPHFSPLVGWVHQKDNTFFDEGKTATKVIEHMAEDGVTATLVDELKVSISEGKGLKSYIASGLSCGVGTISIDVDVSTQFPSMSLATMLAPNPDWYVACVAVNLLNENYVFVPNKTVVGHVYDAGTDNGTTFTSSNSDTNPKGTISRITQPPLGNGTEVKPSLCSITFVKK